MKTLEEVREILRERVDAAGGVREFVSQAEAAGHNVSRATIYQVLEGHTGPGPVLLRHLGLRRLVGYEDAQPKR